MGVYDRDYMLEKKPEKLTPASTSTPPRQPLSRAPLWARIKFRLWLWVKGRG